MALAIPPRQMQGDGHLEQKETASGKNTKRKQVGNNT